MSNPDASAGPYASNEKKPIGGNILAHASTTRWVVSSHIPDYSVSSRVRDDICHPSEWHR
ncbi:hypothetical protein BV25DRAFT_1818648 [Artomyces pyxidatus]|uniref:Uncharacterized protein n=1 Tax=Artomyces pyxidatus TaxID=48021 RepID=A0ACB8TIK4_9AGAM|nr:hypothetical protein BV25DRAFT_1818648 [Artomyces pyxidatus]